LARQTLNELPVRVNREAPSQALQPFTEYFKGFEKVAAVREVFGDETEEVLGGLKVGFMSNRQMYMGVRDHDGNLVVGTYHLRHSSSQTLYLDIVHELFHIGQWRKDKEWFTREHERFMGNFELYYVSPIEVPAYKHAVREGERLGMTPEEITEYLKMMPVSDKTWKGFLKEMGVGKAKARGADPPPRLGRIERLPVRFNRSPKLVLFPFKRFFVGFDDAPPVKAMFGGTAKRALSRLKVEFIESPFGTIFPSEEDGHLVVNSSFLRGAELESIYLDVILCMNFLDRATKSRTASLDSGVEFGENPLVLASYKAMVKEARRIGTPDPKIMERLGLPEFMMSDGAFKTFVQKLGLKPRK
jgi:hypothetical protein